MKSETIDTFTAAALCGVTAKIFRNRARHFGLTPSGKSGRKNIWRKSDVVRLRRQFASA